jgi:hypothetical protein
MLNFSGIIFTQLFARLVRQSFPATGNVLEKRLIKLNLIAEVFATVGKIKQAKTVWHSGR